MFAWVGGRGAAPSNGVNTHCDAPSKSAKSDDPAVPKSIDPLASQIASIQDSAYPQAEHQLPSDEIFVEIAEENVLAHDDDFG